MVLILGKNFKNNLKISNVLKSFYGLSNYMTDLILNDLSISKNITLEQLNQSILSKIQKLIEKLKVDVEEVLKEKLTINIRKLKLNKCYRGYRHINNLPLRGQRTRSNSVNAKKLLAHVSKSKKSNQY